ncbi:MAG: glycosyltransferase family 2 protein [Armatimonadota bacterium]|nr:glycosyltransferase family 2 protein [Armatimonadota bacterium]
MSRLPLVSVVMPVYNAADTVEDAVRSLLRQTYANLEVVVVDDGSTDRSAALVEAMGDTRVRILKLEHGGIVRARNAGCAEARGLYLAVLDSDDIAHERRIAAQVEYLERRPTVGLLGTYARFVYDDGAERVFAPPVDDRALRRYLLWDNPFVHSSVMYRKQAFEDAKGYTPGPVANEDYRLWIEMARSWKLGMIPEVLVTYRVRGSSASRASHRRLLLRARLAAQWRAAAVLGPWSQALPALTATSVAYVLHGVGGPLEVMGRRVAQAPSGRLRGFRPRGSGPRST